jgi:hypothetical protein
MSLGDLLRLMDNTMPTTGGYHCGMPRPRSYKVSRPGVLGPRVTRVHIDRRGNKYISQTNSGTELALDAIKAFLVALAAMAVAAVVLIVVVVYLMLLIAWPIGAATHSPSLRNAHRKWFRGATRQAAGAMVRVKRSF